MTDVESSAARGPAGLVPTHGIDLRVGRNLRGLRRARGLTQKQLGAGVGLTLQQIQKYENGSNRINVARLYEFSRILDVPVARFFAAPSAEEAGRDGAARTAAPASADRAEGLAPDEAELVDLLRKVTPRMKRRLICLVEVMAEEAR